jgi:uncharacterized protein (DUF2147 family)
VRPSLSLLIVALVAALPVPAAASITGVWLTEEGEARIAIEPCETDELCGRLVWFRDPPVGEAALDVRNPDPALRDRRLLGLRLIEDLPARPDEHGVWRGGRIYDPESGRTYRCKVTLGEDGRLELRGFLGVSLLGRTTRWTRVEHGGPGSGSPWASPPTSR